MKRLTLIVAAIILVVLVVVGYVLYASLGSRQVIDANQVPMGQSWQEYRNDTLGIAFSYPSTYVVQEAERGNGERGHYAIALIRADDAASIPEGGEGPTAITIDIYQNNLDNLSLTDWLTSTNDSNFKLSPDGTYASTTVSGGVEAVTYRWSGLYEGETTAFLHRDNVVAISVTYMSRVDEILSSYRSILGNLELF